MNTRLGSYLMASLVGIAGVSQCATSSVPYTSSAAFASSSVQSRISSRSVSSGAFTFASL